MARGLFSVSNLIKESEASKNIASLFLRRIEEAYVKLEPDYKPSIYYKPSSLVCIRQMYFTRKGIEPEKEIVPPAAEQADQIENSDFDVFSAVTSMMND